MARGLKSTALTALVGIARKHEVTKARTRAKRAVQNSLRAWRMKSAVLLAMATMVRVG